MNGVPCLSSISYRPRCNKLCGTIIWKTPQSSLRPEREIVFVSMRGNNLSSVLNVLWYCNGVCAAGVHSWFLVCNSGDGCAQDWKEHCAERPWTWQCSSLCFCKLHLISDAWTELISSSSETLCNSAANYDELCYNYYGFSLIKNLEKTVKWQNAF